MIPYLRIGIQLNIYSDQTPVKIFRNKIDPLHTSSDEQIFFLIFLNWNFIFVRILNFNQKKKKNYNVLKFFIIPLYLIYKLISNIIIYFAFALYLRYTMTSLNWYVYLYKRILKENYLVSSIL